MFLEWLTRISANLWASFIIWKHDRYIKRWKRKNPIVVKESQGLYAKTKGTVSPIIQEAVPVRSIVGDIRDIQEVSIEIMRSDGQVVSFPSGSGQADSPVNGWI